MTRFTHTGQDQMIDGCKFIYGIYETNDPYKIDKLRKSSLFGKTVFEIVKEIKAEEPIIEPTPKTDVIDEIPKSKPKVNVTKPRPRPKIKRK